MTAAEMLALAPTLDLQDPLTRLALADAIEETAPSLACNLALLRGEGPVEMREGVLYPVLEMRERDIGGFLPHVLCEAWWGETWCGRMFDNAAGGGAGHEQVAANRMTPDERRKYLDRFAFARSRLWEQLAAENSPAA